VEHVRVRQILGRIANQYSLRARLGGKATVALCAGAALFLCATTPAAAVSLLIGDEDGFGFTTVNGLLNANGDPADADGDGLLDVGDALPDVNGNQTVASGNGDDWDNRSSAEKANSNAKWTDVTLSNSFSGDPGSASDASVTFSFTVPTAGQAAFEVDHYVNIVGGDFDKLPLTVRIDGTTVGLTTAGSQGLPNGGITLTYVEVPWSDMTDGEVNLDFSVMANEPYVAFDYFLLSETIMAIPEPSTYALAGLGFALLAWSRRSRRRAS